MMSLTQKRLSRCVALALAGIAAQAAAQEAAQTVVVTAQSRKQSVQDVPIAIQVVTMKDIDALGATDLSDLNGYVPGLTVDGREPTQPGFGIRGVNPGDFGIATDAPVGIYVDGVYTGKTGGALQNFIDVARIEVIKGPQGTLFGRNSAAGAISIVTNEPGKEFDAGVRLKVGRFGRSDVDGYVNMPVNAQSGLRLAFVRNESDGWVHNTATDRDGGGESAWATRLSFMTKAGQAKVNVTWEHERLDQEGRAAFAVVQDPTIPFLPLSLPADELVGMLTGTDAATGNYLLGLGGVSADRRGTPLQVLNAAGFRNPLAYVDPLKAPMANDAPGAERRKFDGVTVRVEMPVGGATLNSTTGYRGFKTYNETDNDGSARDLSYLATLDAKTATSWQQEFKLSAKSDTIDWVAGASWYHNDESQEAGAFLSTGSLRTLATLQVYDALSSGGAPTDGQLDLISLLGALPSNLPWREITYAGVVTRSVSAYADAIWHATPATNVTFGVRWTRDSKHASWYVPRRDSADLDALLAQYEALGAIPPGTLAALPPNIAFLDAVLRGASTRIGADHSWTDVSPRLVVDHKLSADTLLFASLSRGYQAGGYNIFVPNPADDAAGRFEPEKMTNLEIGIKQAVPSLGGVVNASLFKYKFKNLQDIQLVTPPGGGVPTYNVIVSDQEATGLDIDARFRLSKALSVFAGAEYIDQTYSRFIDPLGIDLSGQPVGTPRLTAMAGMNLAWPVAGGHGSVTLQGTHTSARRCNDAQSLDDCVDIGPLRTGLAQTRFDLKVGWETGDRRLGAALLVNNLFDKRYVESLGGQTEQIGLPYAYVTRPRFIGLELRAAM